MENTNLWLIKLDKAKPGVTLSRKVFEDVREYYMKSFSHDVKLVTEHRSGFFEDLKPRMKQVIMDYMFKIKYEKFEHIFADCSVDFMREMVNSSEFLYYTAQQDRDYEDPYFYQFDTKNSKDNLPVIIEAFEKSNDLFVILEGHIHIMDMAGMYDYGVISKGSYFGDINILLDRTNPFSYFYNPFQTSALQLLKIPRKAFIDICNKYPLEKDLLVQTA